ncbi:MAG TPA: hypothetical protein VMJ34_18675 [Bryobacteraceae bacterium]|nr:hypothetical protein [Bryobacteraceae bacterium]
MRVCAFLIGFVLSWGMAAGADPITAVFTGTVTSVTKSDLALKAEGDNVLSFSILHKTRFLKDGKPAKRSDVRPGDTVTVQAGEDPDGHPAALTVTIGRTPEKAPQASN